MTVRQEPLVSPPEKSGLSILPELFHAVSEGQYDLAIITYQCGVQKPERCLILRWLLLTHPPSLPCLR